jgi:hypothetical protein
MPPRIFIGFLTALVFCSIGGPILSMQTQETAGGAPPNAEQQKAMLAAIGRYAEQYVSNLPNFLCALVTEQYEANKKGEHWKRGDTLTMRLAFSGGHEKQTLEQVNNKPLRDVTRRWRTSLTTEGEFGGLLEMVFADQSNAAFEWNRWDTLNGKRVAVFDYAIDQRHSTLKLSLSDLASAIVPYRGSFMADPESGQIWKINDQATEIPKEVQTREIGTDIEYSEISISDVKYLLPLHATVLMKTDRSQTRHELVFQDYRKFGAESTITFGDDNGNQNDKTPPPPRP